MKKIAVILCGSGYRDGSEIHESVAVLWALSQFPVTVKCFAPDAEQYDVINCLTGQPMKDEHRNMWIESARIARGNVRPLKELTDSVDEYSGIILPGGFGAAKNLCNFAFRGSQASVLPELQSALRKFYSANKPIGAICIAPMIIALAFKNQGFELTVGAPCEASEEIKKLGHRHVETKANECQWDSKNRIATAPAYMIGNAPLFEIFEGIRKVVEKIVQ